jgi:PAS domain S-box-containing protein
VDEPERNVELRLRAAVESSPSGLLMIDANGTIVLVNREVERLFGYAREELLGHHVELLVPERFREHHPGFRAGFGRAPSIRAMGAGRNLFGRRKDGTEVPVEIGLTPVATAEGLFVISSIVDITARRAAETEQQRLEEQLRQSQKLEALGRLAGGIAHDFNNILGAIVGYAELVGSSDISAEASADVQQLLKAAARGKELVDRILRFSRRQDVVPRAVDLAQVVGEVTRLLRATLPASIEIVVASEERVPRVMADTTSVHQVLMNLATNASHAMEQGGRLDIELRPFFVRDSFARANPGLREGMHLLLAVRDTGHGMDEETLARAFEPFFTTKDPGSGSGLGLAQVHGILRDHGGTVWIESTAGAGTTVSCLFPAIDGAEVEPAAQASAVSSGRGERILYVDDEAALAEVGRRRLSTLGYDVVTSSDPLEALERFAAAPSAFDAVVTDYSMPRMNGIELASRLTAIRPEVPILLVTGYMDDFPHEVVAAAGVRRVLAKPVTLAGLGDALSSLLDVH